MEDEEEEEGEEDDEEYDYCKGKKYTWGGKIQKKCRESFGAGSKWDRNGKLNRGGQTRTYCKTGYKKCMTHRYVQCCSEPAEAKEPVDCTMSQWSEWTACSSSCGSATRSRSRTEDSPAKDGGTCNAAKDETAACDEKPCPLDCVMGAWKLATECSKTCGKGTRTYTRHVTPAENGGKKCEEGADKKTEECNKAACPIDCTMGEWEMLDGTCKDETGKPIIACGKKGWRTLNRKVETEAANGGQECPEQEKTEVCETGLCEASKIIVKGKVVDNSDNQHTLEGVEVKISGDYDGTKTTVMTKAGGEFYFEMNDESGKTLEGAGLNMKLVATKDKWSNGDASVTIKEDAPKEIIEKSIIIEMSEQLPAKAWKFALRWTGTKEGTTTMPNDLDVVIKFGKNVKMGGTSPSCFLNYESGHEKVPCSNGMTAHLDQDHCYPPANCNDQGTVAKSETVTLEDVDPDGCKDDCDIYYKVNNFKANGNFVTALGDVKVYNEKQQEPCNVFNTANAGKGIGYIKGNDWYVFKVDAKNGKVTMCADESICPEFQGRR